MNIEERVQFLRTTPLLADLEPATVTQMAQHFVPRIFPAKSTIFYEGDPGRALYLLQRGQVRIFVNGEDGHETSVILFGQPGEIFGELAIVDGLPRSATAVALAETVVLVMDREAFRRFMRRFPQLALNFMKVLSLKVRYNTRQVDSLASLEIAQRLARKLLELGQHCGVAREAGVALEISLTQSDLASLVGATRESVNKVLRHFRDRDLIALDEGALTLLDVDGLREEGRLAGA